MDCVNELEKQLVSEIVYNEREAYMLYSRYAVAVGFKVCRGRHCYFSGTKTIKSKSYCCSNKNPVTRTGCGAMISFTCDSTGKWSVSKFTTPVLVASSSYHASSSPVPRLSLKRSGILPGRRRALPFAAKDCWNSSILFSCSRIENSLPSVATAATYFSAPRTPART